MKFESMYSKKLQFLFLHIIIILLWNKSEQQNSMKNVEVKYLFRVLYMHCDVDGREEVEC